MTRSLKKGPYVDAKLAKKVAARKPGSAPIKTWARASQIPPEFVGADPLLEAVLGAACSTRHVPVAVLVDPSVHFFELIDQGRQHTFDTSVGSLVACSVENCIATR